MNETVTDLREQARDATYSSDREDAIERLADYYPNASESERDAIAQTLVEIATDATYGDERSLAQNALHELATSSEPGALKHAVRAYSRLAAGSKRREERERALDRLRTYHHESLPQRTRDQLRETYQSVINDARREAERRRARDALTDLAEVEANDTTGDGTNEGTGDESTDPTYLAVSLADHVEAACEDSVEACRRRLDELHAFVAQHPVSDDAYADIESTLTDQAEQLETVASQNGGLDTERRERLNQLADRVRRLYLRGEVE